MNEWESLAGLQALSIYIFIRMDEGEKEWNNLDVLLQSTVIVLSQQLAFHDLTGKTSSASGKSGSELEWETWIFGESRRRLVFLSSSPTHRPIHRICLTEDFRGQLMNMNDPTNTPKV